MKSALAIALALVLFVSLPAAAQSKVADIYAEMARNAARAAQERADIYAKMIADLATAAAAAIPPRVVAPAPILVAPAAGPSAVAAAAGDGLDWWTRNAPGRVRTPEEYLAEALAYEKEQDLARRAAPLVLTDADARRVVRDAETAERMVIAAGFRSVAFSACGILPIKPIPPIGCRDLVAQCVVDREGHQYWQWVCVK